MGDCIYNRLIALYSRTLQGEPIQCFRGDVHSVQSICSIIDQQAGSLSPDSYRCLLNITIHSLSSSPQPVDIHELEPPDSFVVVGIALRPASAECSTSNFDTFLCRLLLQRLARISKAVSSKQVIEKISITEKVVDHFNNELLFHPSNSQWDSVGRDYFLKRVSFFTSRELTIEMCLPAFPCKSSNPDKVAGTLPDRGEELALRRLYTILRRIKSIYQPGARICIISDGHVFSDCSK